MPIEKLKSFYSRHQRWIPPAFFVMGFLFDALMLRRIDEPFTLIQQALYLILTAWLIRSELLETQQQVTPPRFLAKVWKYREWALDFLLGTLLNSYTIFYFKSASALTSFVFIAVLATVLLMNEFKKFGKSQARVHMALWSLCLISYLVALVPILLGYIGTVPFLLSMTCSAVLFYFFFKLFRSGLSESGATSRTLVLYPSAGVFAAFIALYFLRAIPPVPLSVIYIGIYHDVKKVDGQYQLYATRPAWRFWENGDQTFYARPGDVIHCYAQIFSPGKFKTRMKIRWLYKDPRAGWTSSDEIELPVSGGREEGYRAVTKKEHYQPGDWRIQIETVDEREVGRISFTVIEAK